MKPKISIITLGVQDLAQATDFYETLGFVKTAESNDDIVFFGLATSAMRFALYPIAKLAEDIGIETPKPGASGITLAHNTKSPEMVDEVLAEAKAAGAEIIKAGQEVFWGGYSGYFRDLDGYLWEVAHNPFADLT